MHFGGCVLVFLQDQCSCLWASPFLIYIIVLIILIYLIKSCFPSLGVVIMGAFTVWTCWVLCIYNLLQSQGLFSVLSDFVVVGMGRGGEEACLPSAQVPASCWGSWSIENSCLLPSSLLCRFPCLQVRPMLGMLSGTLPLPGVMPTHHTWMMCSQTVISPR